MRNLLVSFSGGETSAYMGYLIKQKLLGNWDRVVFVFANTSKENEETLEFIKKCDDAYGFGTVWIESTYKEGKGVGYRVVDYDTAKRNGEVFEDMIKAYGLPNQAFPHCTRELKTQPITRWAKDQFKGQPYYTAIGIREDEIDRIDSKHKEKRYYYPLCENGITKQHVNAFWKSQPFRLNLKGYEGNCDLCWKKSTRKLITILKHNPEKAEWWNDMTEKYGDYIPPHRNRSGEMISGSFYRKSMSVKELVDLSKQEFVEAMDDTQNTNIQTSIFDQELDKGFGCEESCEPF